MITIYCKNSDGRFIVMSMILIGIPIARKTLVPFERNREFIVAGA